MKYLPLLLILLVGCWEKQSPYEPEQLPAIADCQITYPDSIYPLHIEYGWDTPYKVEQRNYHCVSGFSVGEVHRFVFEEDTVYYYLTIE